MLVKVYKSLDKPSSLFGVRGSYLRYLLIGAFLSFAFGMGFVGRQMNSLIGFIVSVVLLLAVYGGILAFQSRYSERERDKLIASKMLPEHISVRPVDLKTCNARRREQFLKDTKRTTEKS